MYKKLISLAAAAVMVLSLPFSAYAHSGRTDSSGGHRDNKNVSGLGYYHYHCGGYPAHLHENGVCPYKNSSGSSSTASTTTASLQPKAEWIGDMYWDGEKFAEGWTVIGGKTYYFKDNSYVTGWCEDADGNVYYFSSKGVMQTGWQGIGGKKYFFSTEGIMRTGLRSIDGVKYYFDEDGVLKSGKIKVGSKTYYFGKDGAMYKGWLDLNGHTYYFKKKDGSMTVGKLKIDDTVYEFDKNGRLLDEKAYD